jgi:hypothetical protein
LSFKELIQCEAEAILNLAWSTVVYRCARGGVETGVVAGWEGGVKREKNTSTITIRPGVAAPAAGLTVRRTSREACDEVVIIDKMSRSKAFIKGTTQSVGVKK